MEEKKKKKKNIEKCVHMFRKRSQSHSKNHLGQNNIIDVVATLTLGSRPKQRLARLQAKREARE
jgi:hypothetical protein